MKRISLLAIIASVMVMMFALTLGSASAHDEFVGNGEQGINKAINDTSADRPIGDGAGLTPAGGVLADGAATDGITRNPLCPLNPDHDHNHH